MTPKRLLRRVWPAIGAFVLTLPLAAYASSPPAQDLAGTSEEPLAVQKRAPSADRVEAVLRFLEFVTDTVGTSNEERAASPHEPPGKPPDRPPDKPGQHDPPNPPGKPPDRPPDHANNDKDKPHKPPKH